MFLGWWYSDGKRACMYGALVLIFQFLISTYCVCVQCVKSNSYTHDLCTFLYVNYTSIKSLPKSKQTQSEIPLHTHQENLKLKGLTISSAGKDVEQLKILFTASKNIY